MRRRQLAAIVALVVGVATIVLGIAVAVSEFPRGLVLLGCVVVVAAAAWYGVLRRGAARVAGLTIAALALAGALVVLIANGAPFVDLLVVAGLLVSLAAARATLAVHVDLPDAPTPRRPVLFFNPRSGGGKAERFALADEARARGIEPIELKPGDDLEQLVREAVERGADALAMAGGDGSQAIVAAIAAERGLPYGCVPAGTRNHFALDLGVDRDDVVGALDAFVDGDERIVDLAGVNGRVFVNNVSLGLYAEAVQREGIATRSCAPCSTPCRMCSARAAETSTCAGPARAGTNTARGRWCSSPTTNTGSAALSAPARGRGSTTACSGSRSWASPPGAARAAVRCSGPCASGRRPASKSTPTGPFPPASTARRSSSTRRCASASGPASCACGSRASTRAPRPRPKRPRA